MQHPIDLLNQTDEESTSSTYFKLAILNSFLAATIYALAQAIESKNHLDYESRLARFIAGYLVIFMTMFHLSSNNKKISNPPGSLYALGPHRTGKEAFAFAVMLEGGTPPRFMATDAFDWIPGVKWFLEKFLSIKVPANPANGNRCVIDQANQALREKGCVAIFPQGGFSLLNDDPRSVYSGIAQSAIETETPIRVIRLDGFNSINNSKIHPRIRNHSIYRALMAMFHPDEISARECYEIDFHLKNKELETKEKINVICAQLYAFFAHTEDLSDEQLEGIKTKIAANEDYIETWNKKFKLEKSKKELVAVEKSIRQIKKTRSSLSFWQKSCEDEPLAELMQRRDELKAKIPLLQAEVRQEEAALRTYGTIPSQ